MNKTEYINKYFIQVVENLVDTFCDSLPKHYKIETFRSELLWSKNNESCALTVYKRSWTKEGNALQMVIKLRLLSE